MNLKCSQFPGEKQPWAEPVGANIRLVSDMGPNDKPSYRTMATQPGAPGQKDEKEDGAAAADGKPSEDGADDSSKPSESDVRHRDTTAAEWYR